MCVLGRIPPSSIVIYHKSICICTDTNCNDHACAGPKKGAIDGLWRWEADQELPICIGFGKRFYDVLPCFDLKSQTSEWIKLFFDAYILLVFYFLHINFNGFVFTCIIECRWRDHTNVNVLIMDTWSITFESAIKPVNLCFRLLFCHILKIVWFCPPPSNRAYSCF